MCALALPGRAGAHALLVRVAPADGSRLDSAPGQVRLWFSEEISPAFRSAQLIRPGGEVVKGVRLDTARSGSNTIALDLPERLDHGTYAVVWRAVSKADGHATDGTTVFAIGAGAPLIAPVNETPSPARGDVALRWLHFSLLAGLIGGLAVALVLSRVRRELPHKLARLAAQRVVTLSAASGILAACVAAAALVRQALAATGADYFSASSALAAVRETLVASRWGELWLVQETLLVALVAAVLAYRRRAPAPSLAFGGAGVLLAGGIVVTEALSSHAAALRPSTSAVTADALHLLAASIWIGGIAAFLAVLLPLGRYGRSGSAAVASACRRPFALLAGASVATLVVTGLYSAGLQIASVDALLMTFYGRTLLAKTALLLALGAFGAANAILLRRVPAGRLRIPIAVEAVCGLAALLAAAVLTASPPARGSEFAAPRPVHAPMLTREVDDLVLSASVRPNRPGENVLTVLTASSRRPPPASISSVRVRLQQGQSITLNRVEAGRYLGSIRLDNPGVARMEVVVGRGGSRLAAPFRWSVETADPARPVRVSSRKLSSLVDPAAGLLLLALALGLGIALVARRAGLRPVAGLSVKRPREEAT